MIHPSSSHTNESVLIPILMGTVCLKCGDEGFPETLVFCKECQACALHRYCLNGPVVFWEEVIWFCEDCEVKLVKPSSFDIRVSASPENSDSISLENDANKATKKLRNCINKVKKSNQQAHNIIEERKLNKRKISNQLAHKTVEEKHDKRQINNQRQQKIIEEEKLKKRKVISQQKQDMIEEEKLKKGKVFSQQKQDMIEAEKLKKGKVISQQKQDTIEEEKQMKRKAIPDTFAKTKALLSDNHKMPLPAQPIAKPIWRGSLNFRNEAGGVVTELLAHMSSLACSKVEEETQLLPKVLHADLLPRSVVWPKSFKYEGPTDMSIALYFFPQSQRDEKAFDKLVDDIIQLELAIRVAAKNADLTIFPSTALPVQHRRMQAKYYLWGVFRGKQTSRKMNGAVSIADSGVYKFPNRQTNIGGHDSNA
ncbi:hypothetical protein HN51_029797 [Arachis hypogaea]|uniref:AIPP2-like SPOC-like domain-containing protein n=1 Tax=Arachis hypogaea TaxID=3818 RepID=A0A445BDH8_ARAHY|nr:uncharacterized protein LOC112712419 [Arachis hypogaea]QHO36503.1 uncharacterized protein DS421_9g284320 [Arachis hypogaea]RYR36734.1 hypothetical protein Ahy_A09g041690 [Arachis hypogaea]